MVNRADPHSSARGRHTQVQGSHRDLTTQQLVFPRVPTLVAPPFTGRHSQGLRERLPVSLSQNKSEPHGLAEFWDWRTNSDAFTGTVPTGWPALLCLLRGAGIPDDFLLLCTIQREQRMPHLGNHPGCTRPGSSPQHCMCSGLEGSGGVKPQEDIKLSPSLRWGGRKMH